MSQVRMAQFYSAEVRPVQMDLRSRILIPPTIPSSRSLPDKVKLLRVGHESHDSVTGRGGGLLSKHSLLLLFQPNVIIRCLIYTPAIPTRVTAVVALHYNGSSSMCGQVTGGQRAAPNVPLVRMSAKLLLAPLPEIHTLKTIKDKDVLVVTAAGSGARRCPDCGTASTSRKGGYVRQLQDLPVQGIAVRLEVRMTRWRCRNDECERRSFVERLEKSAPCHARRTRRVSELARLLGHATGGLAAERLLFRLGIPQSDDTVLRTVKLDAASRRKPALRVAGIDDWSWQQGRNYGTIVVDLERREVVDVIRGTLG